MTICLDSDSSPRCVIRRFQYPENRGISRRAVNRGPIDGPPCHEPELGRAQSVLSGFSEAIQKLVGLVTD